jgi:hypothetical protein
MLGAQFVGLAFTGTPRLGLVTFLACLAGMSIGHDVVQYAGHHWLLHNRHFRWLGHDIHHGAGASESGTSCYMSHAHGEHHRRWQVSFSDGFGSPGLCDFAFGTRWDRR